MNSESNRRSRMKRKILAWDDKPEHYLEDLQRRVARHGIHLEIETDVAMCRERFAADPSAWDCLILDVVDESSPSSVQKNAGIRLAQSVRSLRSDVPIVFVTADLQALLTEGAGIGPPMLVRPKNYSTQYMTIDLQELLESRPQLDRVFLIYGRNRESGNIKEEVTKAISDGWSFIGPNITCVTLN